MSMDEKNGDGRYPQPDYAAWPTWEAYSKTLDVEYTQCLEEGMDIAPYEALFRDVRAMSDCREKEKLAEVLFDLTQRLPQRAGYRYTEPSELDAITAASERIPSAPLSLSREKLADRIRGAWYGRICGCLLGKPCEGMKRAELETFLKRTKNYPMFRYMTREEAEKNDEGLRFPIARRCYPAAGVDAMPPDDDTNYIVLAYLCVKGYGRDFTSRNMESVWLGSQGKDAYCTAERAAFRNFVNGFVPPDSARYHNAYREWIGAQIRGDYFGWINPGDPACAAEMAWRDARLSHIKNGIYGEMFISAMLALAPCEKDLPTVIEKGLSYIPRASRLWEAVRAALVKYRRGGTADEFFRDFHTRWDDRNSHHWCHVISNAEIVTAALLWGGNDYGKSVCLAVQQGFDTDCNGATVGSILGMFLGASALPRAWIGKINGTLRTSIFGWERLSVDQMAEWTMRHLNV